MAIPLITVAIPFYNASHFLEKAITSVLNQTFVDFELLLLDDGSKDNSLEIAHKFKDKRIKIISDGKNRGLVYRLNQSIQIARGKYYARMDADDIMHPSRLEIQIDYLRKNPNINILGTSFYSINAEDQIMGCIIVKQKCTPTSFQIVHPSIIGLTTWFINNKYDRRYHRIEDKELWMRTIHDNNFENLEIPLMFYREYGVPTWKKYTHTQINAIKIYSQRNKYKLKFGYSFKHIIYTITKIIIASLLSLIGKEELLISMRKWRHIKYNKELAYNSLKTAITFREEII